MKKLKEMSVDGLVEGLKHEDRVWNGEDEIYTESINQEHLGELIRRAKLIENKSDVIKELKSLNMRFLYRYPQELPYKENCDEEIFSANDFFYFINERIAELKGVKDGK